jgi:glycine cleavage system H protein
MACVLYLNTRPAEITFPVEDEMQIPTDLKYTDNDEWIRVEGNIGTVGITDFAQNALSDIVYVEATVSSGDALSKGDSVAELESVKAAAYAYMPVDGVVTEVNEDLPDSPETVNSDPYGVAWMVKFEISDPSQLDALMDAATYQKYSEEREH